MAVTDAASFTMSNARRWVGVRERAGSMSEQNWRQETRSSVGLSSAHSSAGTDNRHSRSIAARINRWRGGRSSARTVRPCIGPVVPTPIDIGCRRVNSTYVEFYIVTLAPEAGACIAPSYAAYGHGPHGRVAKLPVWLRHLRRHRFAEWNRVPCPATTRGCGAAPVPVGGRGDRPRGAAAAAALLHGDRQRRSGDS